MTDVFNQSELPITLPDRQTSSFISIEIDLAKTHSTSISNLINGSKVNAVSGPMDALPELNISGKEIAQRPAPHFREIEDRIYPFHLTSAQSDRVDRAVTREWQLRKSQLKIPEDPLLKTYYVLQHRYLSGTESSVAMDQDSLERLSIIRQFLPPPQSRILPLDVLTKRHVFEALAFESVNPGTEMSSLVYKELTSAAWQYSNEMIEQTRRRIESESDSTVRNQPERAAFSPDEQVSIHAIKEFPDNPLGQFLVEQQSRLRRDGKDLLIYEQAVLDGLRRFPYNPRAAELARRHSLSNLIGSPFSAEEQKELSGYEPIEAARRQNLEQLWREARLQENRRYNQEQLRMRAQEFESTRLRVQTERQRSERAQRGQEPDWGAERRFREERLSSLKKDSQKTFEALQKANGYFSTDDAAVYKALNQMSEEEHQAMQWGSLGESARRSLTVEEFENFRTYYRTMSSLLFPALTLHSRKLATRLNFEDLALYHGGSGVSRFIESLNGREVTTLDTNQLRIEAERGWSSVGIEMSKPIYSGLKRANEPNGYPPFPFRQILQKL